MPKVRSSAGMVEERAGDNSELIQSPLGPQLTPSTSKRHSATNAECFKFVTCSPTQFSVDIKRKTALIISPGSTNQIKSSKSTSRGCHFFQAIKDV